MGSGGVRPLCTSALKDLWATVQQGGKKAERWRNKYVLPDERNKQVCFALLCFACCLLPQDRPTTLGRRSRAFRKGRPPVETGVFPAKAGVQRASSLKLEGGREDSRVSQSIFPSRGLI